jgi:hypothetical protein
MTKVMRQDKILEILEREKSVNIEDLARELNVSLTALLAPFECSPITDTFNENLYKIFADRFVY